MQDKTVQNACQHLLAKLKIKKYIYNQMAKV